MPTHGGRRPGAGRPQGSGRYRGEATQVLRVPVSLVDATKARLREYSRASDLAGQSLVIASPAGGIPRFEFKVPAGAPTSGEDRADDRLDLNQWLVLHPESTVLYPVAGDSMEKAGILDGDHVVVDRSVEPRSGDIVVAVVSGSGHTLKRFRVIGQRAMLEPESNNRSHRRHKLSFDAGDSIVGVVTGVVRRVRYPARRAA